MTILSLEEDLIPIMEKLGISVAGPASDAVEALARHIESAVIKRLAVGAGEPVAQTLPGNLELYEGRTPWCRQVLLYSGDNNGDLLRGKNIRVPLYTADQVAAAVAAEREACAALVERIQEEEPDDGLDGYGVARVIRRRSTT